jgi:ribonuclease HI
LWSWIRIRHSIDFALGVSFEFSLPIERTAMNIQAKYQAVLKGIKLLREIKVNVIEIFGDSMLVINQLLREYECKNDILMGLSGRISLVVKRIQDCGDRAYSQSI